MFNGSLNSIITEFCSNLQILSTIILNKNPKNILKECRQLRSIKVCCGSLDRFRGW